MKKLLIVIPLILHATFTFSQSYVTAAGLRLGTDWGLSLQQRVAEKTTIEAIFQSSLQREEVLITALAERHYPLLYKGLNLYFGAGPHKGWINEPAGEGSTSEYKDPFGITLIGGAELSLGRINLSYDFKPAMNIRGGEESVYIQSGLSVRYVLISNRDLKKYQKKQRRKERKESGGFQLEEDWKFWKKDRN